MHAPQQREPAAKLRPDALAADALALRRLYAENPGLKRQKEALVANVVATANEHDDDFDQEEAEHASKVYDLLWRAEREKDAEAKRKLDELREKNDDVIVNFDREQSELKRSLREAKATLSRAVRGRGAAPARVVLRPLGHERRESCSGRTKGSRRGADSRAGPSSSDDPPDESDPHHVAATSRSTERRAAI